MKSYYEILNIDKTADARQIKSAYFALARKYTPERAPEEFKKLREAYEILSDTEKRAKYDMAENLPPEAKFLFNQVKQAQHEGRRRDALEILNMIVEQYPELDEMRVELARSYEKEDKPGKAMEVWKTLCERNPGNTKYSIELAESYAKRGWRKKAAEICDPVLKLEPTNARAWMVVLKGLFDSEDSEGLGIMSKKAAEAVRGDCDEDIQIYVIAIISNLYNTEDIEYTEMCIGYITAAARLNAKIYSEELEVAFEALLIVVGSIGDPKLISYMRELAGLLPGLSKEIREGLEDIQSNADIEALKSAGFPELLLEFLDKFNDCDCSECKADIIAKECNILSDIDGYRPYIERIRSEYPHLYKIRADFLDEVLENNMPGNALNRRLRQLASKGWEPVLVSADGKCETLKKQRTFYRDGPKIGRNEPCPCGSGKKYKRCCGV